MITNNFIFSDLDGSQVTCEYKNGVFAPISGEVSDTYKRSTLQESWDALLADSTKIRDLKISINSNLPFEKVELVKNENNEVVDYIPLINYKTKIENGEALAVFGLEFEDIVSDLKSKNINVIIE